MIIEPAQRASATNDAEKDSIIENEKSANGFNTDALTQVHEIFVQGNNLAPRLTAHITDSNDSEYNEHISSTNDVFTIAHLGFGAGLGFLATWQLWNDVRQTVIEEHPLSSPPQYLQQKHLHFIGFEALPLSKKDFIQALLPLKQNDSNLKASVEKLEALYPTVVEGCHRLQFFDDNITLDLWIGDITLNLTTLAMPVGSICDAWFLDDVHECLDAANIDVHNNDAPNINTPNVADTQQRNKNLSASPLFTDIQRLSGTGTTLTTPHSINIVERQLIDSGFTTDTTKTCTANKCTEKYTDSNYILSAYIAENPATVKNSNHNNTALDDTQTPEKNITEHHVQPVIIIGAGVSGLMTAWSLAKRGIKVRIVDKIAPMAGASGNPRALLAPKMTPIHHVADHLHSIGYLFGSRLYRQLNLLSIHADNSLSAAVIEETTALDFMAKANISAEQIGCYPQDFAQVLPKDVASAITGLPKHDFTMNQFLPQAGLINPQALATVILAEPNICYEQLTVDNLNQRAGDNGTPLWHINGVDENNQPKHCIAKNVIVCSAYHSHALDPRIFDFRKIRGQISWFTPTAEQRQKLPQLPIKFGGYFTPFTPKTGDDSLNDVEVGVPHVLMGASFVRNELDTSVIADEHQQNLDKLTTAIPELTAVMNECAEQQWQGRAGIRSQTPDYHPLVGEIDTGLWTMSGMGAKGYAYAPICAEVLADLMTGRSPPLSTELLARLNPQRRRLQTPLN